MYKTIVERTLACRAEFSLNISIYRQKHKNLKQKWIFFQKSKWSLQIRTCTRAHNTEIRTCTGSLYGDRQNYIESIQLYGIERMKMQVSTYVQKKH